MWVNVYKIFGRGTTYDMEHSINFGSGSSMDFTIFPTWRDRAYLDAKYDDE